MIRFLNWNTTKFRPFLSNLLLGINQKRSSTLRVLQQNPSNFEEEGNPTIYYHDHHKRWLIQVKLGMNEYHIGYYEREKEASFHLKAMQKQILQFEEDMKFRPIDAGEKEKEARRFIKNFISDVENKPENSGKSSNYTGINFCPELNKWRAIITISQRLYHIGYFHDEHDAYVSRQFVVENREKLKTELAAVKGGN